MVFVSTCELASSSSAFIFTSTSSHKICLASNEHFKKYIWRAASTGFVNFLGEFRLDLFLLKINVLHQVIKLTPFNQSQQLTANCALLAMMSITAR